MTRTRLIVLACVLALGIGIPAYSHFFTGPSSQDCAPVEELLDYNRQLTEQINADPDNDALYRQWADGLSQRAWEVTNPDLAKQAIDVGDLAGQFVAKLPELRAAEDTQATGSPAPDVAYQMDALNTQITTQLGGLSDACA